MKTNRCPIAFTLVLSLAFALPRFGEAQESGSPEPARAAPGEGVEGAWLDSYNEGVMQAEKEGKDLLLLFTGTDWIEMCEIFFRDVLSQSGFVEPVRERFVLVKLEYPEDNRFPAERRQEAAQLQLLRDAYRIPGFPTLVISDVQGRPFAFTGYQPIGAQQYAAMCLVLAETKSRRAAALEAAEKLEGPRRTEAIARGIPELPGNMGARFFRKEIEAAIAADPQNESGFVDDFRRLIADVDYANAMHRLGREKEWAFMIELTNRYLSEHEFSSRQRQAVLLHRYGAEEKLRDWESAIRTLLAIVETDPESDLGKKAAGVLAEWRRNKIAADAEKANGIPAPAEAREE